MIAGRKTLVGEEMTLKPGAGFCEALSACHDPINIRVYFVTHFLN